MTTHTFVSKVMSLLFNTLSIFVMASLVAQTVKRLSAMQETRFQSLGQEDALEREMATHSSTFAWEIHGRRSLVGYSPWGRKELDTTERLHFHFSYLNLSN